jgi:N-acetyltransferase
MDMPVLEGSWVRLEPLSAEHLPALERIVYDPSIWRFMAGGIDSAESLQNWFDEAIRLRDAGTGMPWVTVLKGRGGAPDEVVGSTRFIDLNLTHRTVEIGNTWLIDTARGTRMNTDAKLLQLRYAFEDLKFVRVAFKTHVKNLRSQAAIRGLGANYEGTFRNHMIMPDGSRRDTAWYSIIDTEWPEVRETLERRLRAPVPA